MNRRHYKEPPPLKRLLLFGKSGPDVKELQELLQTQGFFKGSPKGNFRELTKEAVQLFQNTHIDRNGLFLIPDGVVGPKTWFALHNPSGSVQKSFIELKEPKTIYDSETRLLVLSELQMLYEKGVKEIPDGSNWGDGVTTIIEGCGISYGIPWCLALQSYVDKKAYGEAPLGKMHVHCSSFWNEALKWGRAFRKGDYRPIPGDIAIYNYRDSFAKLLKGAGHATRVVGVSEDGRSHNAIEGNAGNRMKHSLRRESEKSLVGYVNLFKDEENPPEFAPSLVHGAPSTLTLADTR